MNKNEGHFNEREFTSFEEAEMRTHFDGEELDKFYDSFAPLEMPAELFDLVG